MTWTDLKDRLESAGYLVAYGPEQILQNIMLVLTDKGFCTLTSLALQMKPESILSLLSPPFRDTGELASDANVSIPEHEPKHPLLEKENDRSEGTEAGSD